LRTRHAWSHAYARYSSGPSHDIRWEGKLGEWARRGSGTSEGEKEGKKEAGLSFDRRAHEDLVSVADFKPIPPLDLQGIVVDAALRSTGKSSGCISALEQPPAKKPQNHSVPPHTHTYPHPHIYTQQ
jgi:hypothetical protein